MTTTDDDLSQLERDVRQLKIEYEQYFGGGKARPPADIEWRIETMLKRHGDRGANMNYAQRFRYSSLAQTYAKYREIFRKRLKQKEEGVVRRHFGAAAREIETERARKGKAVSKSETDVQFPFAISCSDPEQQQKKVEELYAALCKAKQQTGEKAGRLTFETFQQFVRRKSEELKKHESGQEIEYVVSIEGQRARLKARVKSSDAEGLRASEQRS